MIIKPKIRGFICTTTHPVGCEANVQEQITFTKNKGKIANGPKKVLVVGSSSGYGLSSRIAAAFGCDAATIGVFFEKPGTETKPGTAGWYNSAAFDKFAKAEGLYSKSINCDAFSHEAKQKVIELIKQDLGEIDMVVYSLASPVRRLPDSGEVIRSALKPIGETYTATAVDTNKDCIIEATVEPATEQEIADTVTVMGGQDWELWIKALSEAGVLANNCKTVAYSYIGTELTWPIYWHGALGKAKMDLDRAAKALNDQLSATGGSANVAVLKSVVTQASSAIPVMPLYIAMVFKKMRQEGLHEGCMEQIYRMFSERLYRTDGAKPETDSDNRLRLDDWELRDDIQQHCRDLWPQVTTENLSELTDYREYKAEFIKLFGFGIEGIDYDADVNPYVEFDVIELQ
ncbi:MULTISPECIES: enoyl-ACP reductase FabV [Shewanella]|jgi:enoyl-[acyl-carrier protein] reductase/trans-2-enoyl-CoA reductase (NAD+)|uniref:Enoyl-[acyl-carrier-protein] reductase [NADH] n=3 Tax=Shewanella TaxID=22 RepID=FABV_SHESW|nr:MULTISPECIES: enoyl-ACP reductase FabV [Shewanella]A1RL84.1 RecName: Full=Enoyl-[acyl-carrier-protein] reductase [NADH]; Short=ENR [Shewanella sp. W3-18-1]A4Y5I7.1 RecName: Full=Enoyl-[acyl-carrier-protein] reductase [NADH]; Short=ENR [Shewanella putrefaciens CN-32]CAD6366086.1 Enoyl-[acyl-carrier-protein] reductase [NADH] 1 [Shewanella hafniensis]ABM25429.1 short-chain alcohol dehydrogenase [Shewanella sp. W3-18-1]MCA1895959.1 trans-2-enoyl-CoA reductase family protein [Shewanella putrefac